METNPISDAITAISGALHCGVEFSHEDRLEFFKFIGLLVEYEDQAYGLTPHADSATLN